MGSVPPSNSSPPSLPDSSLKEREMEREREKKKERERGGVKKGEERKILVYIRR